MNINTVLSQISQIIKANCETPENVVEAYENSSVSPTLTDKGLVCLSLNKFIISERLTEKDENGEIYTLTTRKHTCTVKMNIYLPLTAHPSLAYTMFNNIKDALLSSNLSSNISEIECSSAQYEKDCNALILTGKVAISENA